MAVASANLNERGNLGLTLFGKNPLTIVCVPVAGPCPKVRSVTFTGPCQPSTRKILSLSCAPLLGLVLTAALPAQTQNAVANGDTRTIHLYHVHTGESISSTFRVNGQYDRAALDKLNWFLRDWRTDEPTKMSPRLFDMVWETYRESGSRQPVHIVSAYRSPGTNSMLRRRSSGVAENSQHILGKAMDMHYVDVPMSKVREIAMRLQRGGVGYYPTAGTPFVHLDVGSVRAWPRMSHDQLARLFPDGKTVHLPTSGQPMARYEEARAEIDARGDGPGTLVARAEPQRASGRGFFERLFGIGEEEDDLVAAAPRARTRIARAPAVEREDSASINTPAQRRAAETIARAERNLPRGETVMTAPVAVTASVVPVQQVAAVQLMPPRRPVELGGTPQAPAAAPVVFANVPLPPVRPQAGLVLASAERGSAPLPVPLPDVIRNGNAAAPDGLMAYAPNDSRLGLRGALTGAPPQNVRVVVRKPVLYAARIDRSNFTLMTQPVALQQAVAAKDLGMRPGLKASVKADSRAWALTAQVQVASEFAPVLVSELRTDAFTGSSIASVQVPAPAAGEPSRVAVLMDR